MAASARGLLSADESLYSSLLLSLVHVCGGSGDANVQPVLSQQAELALQEAIRIAQESNDHVCLQHCLVRLPRLGVPRWAGLAFRRPF